MGIYITNIKMPKTCMKCFCLDPQWSRCQILGKGFSKNEEPMKNRPKWCPLINVQEHGRLIDADALSNKLYEEDAITISGLHILNRFPTIISADKGDNYDGY